MKNSEDIQKVQNLRVSRRMKLKVGMFEEANIFEEQFDNDIFVNLDFGYVLSLINNNELIFAKQIIEEEPTNRTNITDNMIPDTTFITPLIIERQTRTDERRISAVQYNHIKS
jgi:hypothetical protein